MLDIDLVKESVHSFDQSRLVLEFRLINEGNRKMSGSRSVAKKVKLKADKYDIHPDDGLEQKLHCYHHAFWIQEKKDIKSASVYLDTLDSTEADVVTVATHVAYVCDVAPVFHVLAHTK
ncbi:hypothetical protein Tco_0141074, partial [Tanacetum coccineum]